MTSWSAMCWLLLICVADSTGQCADAGADRFRIVTLGDSITKGARPGVTAQQTFAALVEKMLRQQGLKVDVMNVGIGGERTDGALARLDKDVIAKRPQLVTVMYGTNDSYVDAGKTDSRLSRETYRQNLTEIVRRLRAAGATVVLMTEPRWGAAAKNGAGESPNLRLEAYMEACRAVAAEFAKEQPNVPLVDHFAHWTRMEQRQVDLATWTTDSCHPNARGHEDLAHRIVQTVLPIAQRWADRHHGWDEQTPFRITLETASKGYDGQMCWVHPRATMIPGSQPTALLTTQALLLTGSDVFYALNDLRSTDHGVTWTAPREHKETMGRRTLADGVEITSCDFTPKWHAKTGRVLGIGQSVRYVSNRVMENRPRETTYSIYDAASGAWSAWRTIEMPKEPKFVSAGAGSAQRVDLPNGDILLPIYFRPLDEKYYRVCVVRLSFDGTTLKFVEQGNEMRLESGRGLFEPSLVKFGDRYYLTLRNDFAGYVTSSPDGLHFDQPQLWRWDNGEDLGNYNTQQHWLAGPRSLYLVYTRKGANNDHVFRNRAPIFMGEVDLTKLQVKQSTERIVVPERGARLGNFGICEVNDHEAWVTVAEWMQTWSPNHIIRPDNPYGADNSIYAAKVVFTKER